MRFRVVLAVGLSNERTVAANRKKLVGMDGHINTIL